jgi:hypothetical protein
MGGKSKWAGLAYIRAGKDQDGLVPAAIHVRAFHLGGVSSWSPNGGLLVGGPGHIHGRPTAVMG